MKRLRRASAIICIAVLSLALTAPLGASDTTEDPSLIQVLWEWLVDALGDDDGGEDPDGGVLQIPPGTP